MNYFLIMFGLHQDEFYYKSVNQSSPANFHVVKTKTREVFLILTLDGTIHCFYVSPKSGDVLSTSIQISTLLPDYEKAPMLDIISSSILSNERQFLLLTSLLEGESKKLLLFEILNDSLNPIHFKQYLDIDYHPCIAKVIHVDRLPFLITSGVNESLNAYSVDDGRLSEVFIGEILPPLSSKLEAGVVLCIDLLYSESGDNYYLTVGTDSGLVVVWRVLSGTNEIVSKNQHKFDTPVSILKLFYHSSSSDGPLLLASSALGPALIFSNLNDDLLTEFVKFRKSDKYDAIISHFCPPPNDENEIEKYLIFGTFGYKLLVYSVNFIEKTNTLKFVKDFLSPVIGIRKFLNFYVILTCSGIHFFAT